MCSAAVTFRVHVTPLSGKFEITDSTTVLASGRVYLVSNDNEAVSVTRHLERGSRTASSDDKFNGQAMKLSTEDIYKEFLLRGYEYGPTFKGIVWANGLGLRYFTCHLLKLYKFPPQIISQHLST